jgi:hypothetical protein
VGSLMSQFGGFFGSDFGGGGLGCFDVQVIEVQDTIEGICGDGCFPDHASGLENARIAEAMERSPGRGAWETDRRAGLAQSMKPA